MVATGEEAEDFPGWQVTRKTGEIMQKWIYLLVVVLFAGGPSCPATLAISHANGVSQRAVEDDYVYVTESGKKYHKKDCSHLTKNAKRIKRSEVGDRTACKDCKP